MSTVNFSKVKKAFYGGTEIHKIFAQGKKVWPPPKLFPTQLQLAGGGLIYRREFHVGDKWRWSGISGAESCRMFISTDGPSLHNSPPQLPCAIDNDGEQYFSVNVASEGAVQDPVSYNEQLGSVRVSSNRVFEVTFKKALPAGYWWYMGVPQIPGADPQVWDGIEPALVGGPILP